MRIFLVLLALFAASMAHAEDQVGRGPPPAWVRPVPAAAAPALPITAGDAFRIELLDQQFHFDENGSHAWAHTRMALLSPQALGGLGTVVLPWSPSSQNAVVHQLDIIRGDERIDALTGKEFAVLRREENLEAAVLDGVLTATLQVDGLRVGDRLEFAWSVTTRMPVVGDHAEFAATSNFPATVDQYFLRGSWPTASGLRIKPSDDMPAPPVWRRGGESGIEMSLGNLEPVSVPETVPLRFHRVRQLEGSDYRSWAELAALFAPLYVEASTLAPDSPLRARAAQIREAHPTTEGQVLAALRLVQDEVRYLALAMGDGGLVPATADQTWDRRLGDCKGKSTLLLALLRELGVEARPVLAHNFDTSVDQRLPAVSAFNHVIVQAEVDGRTVWLDGARVGDRSLIGAAPLDYGWVLPVMSQGSVLVRMPASPPARPLRDTFVEIDLSKGLYTPGPVTGEGVYRGDRAAALQSQFSVASAAQRDAYMRSIWESLVDDVEIAGVNSTYDTDLNELRMTMRGSVKLDWVSRGVRRAEIPISHISWDAGERREEGPFQDAPFPISYPAHALFRTTIILPDGGEGFTLNAVDIEEEAAAYRHRRRTTKDGARVVMERDTVALRPEMTEAERAAAVEPLARIARLKAEIVAPSSYEATATDLDALETDEPTTATDWINRGLTLDDNDQRVEAIAAYDRAIALEPGNSNAWANRGIARFWQGETDQAAADFDKAIELNASERVALNGRGLVALQQERYLDAVVEFSMSLRARPDDLWALGVRAQAYAGMKEWDKALADIRRVRELSPETLSVDLREVAILVSAERLDEAGVAVDALAERAPTELSVWALQASVREQRGDFAGAETSLSRALELEPDHPVMLLQRAGYRLRLQNLDGARADMAVVRPVARESAGLLNNLCWTQALAGVDLEQALADCDAALALRPRYAGFMDSRALVLLQLGRAPEALELYDQALALEPRQAASLYGRGLAKEALGRADEGRADKDAARRIAPDVGEEFEAYEARRTASGAGGAA